MIDKVQHQIGLLNDSQKKKVIKKINERVSAWMEKGYMVNVFKSTPLHTVLNDSTLGNQIEIDIAIKPVYLGLTKKGNLATVTVTSYSALSRDYNLVEEFQIKC